MSKAFPTDKDNIIDELDDAHHLSLSEEEYDTLRKLTQVQLFTLATLFARARTWIKAEKEEDA